MAGYPQRSERYLMIADALHKKVLCRWKPLRAAKRDLAHFLRAIEARAIALEALIAGTTCGDRPCRCLLSPKIINLVAICWSADYITHEAQDLCHGLAANEALFCFSKRLHCCTHV